MTIPFAQVDVFASGPFTGNPAAVVRPPTGSYPSEGWLADVARELACTNTAFVWPTGDGPHRLRWFTAGGAEVDRCGHATLATVHDLVETGDARPGTAVRFTTRIGELTATAGEAGVALDLPVDEARPCPAPDGLLDALGCDAVDVGRSSDDYVVVVDDEPTVAALTPDLAALAAVECRGVIVTAPADDTTGARTDVVLRFFGPRVGVPEDHVTGTAHGPLAPLWCERLGGRTSYVARQLSPRGGTVHVELDGDRVRIRGRAVTVLRGSILSPP
ncbi:MAG: PhzF family phenazine biosynthesis protein [Actinomycetota bacterium]|nr:PhzF family phenazine biosynthesis protein [Actinomycetota bacterium]